MGAKTTYTQDKANRIAERLSNGETLSAICRDPEMPDRVTVYRWMDANEDFAQQIAHARQLGFESILDECMGIADDSGGDVVETDHGPALDREHVQRSKLRVWTRLELLKRWDPKRYGDLLKQEHSGPSGGPVVTEIRRTIIDPKNDS